MRDNDFKYLKEALAVDLADFLSHDFGLGVAKVLEVLYNSQTYNKLTDPKTGLYFQSPGYVYSFLRSEMMTGSMA